MQLTDDEVQALFDHLKIDEVGAEQRLNRIDRFANGHLF